MYLNICCCRSEEVSNLQRTKCERFIESNEEQGMRVSVKLESKCFISEQMYSI